MALDPVFGSVRINEKTEIAAENLKTECKTEIPSDTVSRVLDVSAFLGGAEYSAEDAKVSGTVIFNVIYSSPDGNVKKYECAQEFSHGLSQDLSGKTFIPRVKIEKAAADVSGTRLSVYAVVSVSGKVCSTRETPCLTGGNVILDAEEKTVPKSFGIKKATFHVEEEIVFPYEVAEVLSQRAQTVITDVQCGVGCIIIDGEAIVSALLLQNSENGDIIKEEKVLPFRFELQCDEAMPANVATAEATVKSVRSDISVDVEAGKSTATLFVAVNVVGEAVAEETVSLAKDAFSETENTALTFSQTEWSFPCGVKTVRKPISGRCPVGIPSGAVIAAVKDETVEIVSLKTDKGISFQGVFSVKALYKDADGKFGTITLETPVEYKEDKGEYDDVEVRAIAVSSKARPVNDAETELSGEMIVAASYSKTKKLKFVGGIESTGEKPVCDAAISVYIPLEGEGLFSLAKRLSVKPETLITTNKELNFPLSGKERIVIYRQK